MPLRRNGGFCLLLCSSILLLFSGVFTQALTITIQPTNQIVFEGDSVDFTVGVESDAPVSFQWYKGDTALAGATAQAFTVPAAGISDAGLYSVLVSSGDTNLLSGRGALYVTRRPQRLASLSNEWKYDQSARNLGTAWRAVGYDDSSWPSGPGLFGYDDTTTSFFYSLIQTPFNVSDDPDFYTVTFYFRLHLPSLDGTQLYGLSFTNLIDDGAVFYLNGNELYRQNLPGAPATITYITAPTRPVEASYFQTNVPVNVSGTNETVIAVEVHQSSPGDDLIFGSEIYAIFRTNGPPIITRHPQSTNVFVGSSVSFTSAASGGPLTFQWLKDGAALPGETNLFLIISQCSFTNAGRYVLQASNLFGAVTSLPADLRVALSNGIPLVVLPFTNGWKYEASGTDLGTAWRQTGYDDTGWQTGRGAFAAGLVLYPEEVNTLVSLTNSVGAKVNTYYFRTHFNLPLQTTNVSVTLSDLLDDGAVYYLNGKEIARVNMSFGTITYNTLASSARADRGTDTLTLAGLLPLVPGDNVLAVEVHQASTTSSDIDFDASIAVSSRTVTPLQVISQPQDVAAREYDVVSLGCALFGSGPVQIQWYQGGTALPGATNVSLVLSNVHASDSGNYYCLASSPLNSVTSRVAQVAVSRDATLPRVLDAISYGPSSVLVRFDEAVDLSSATTLSNYFGFSTLIVSVKRFATNAVLVSFAEPLPEGAQLEVRNVQDLAVPPNSLWPPVLVPVQVADKGGFSHPFTAIKSVFLIMFENHSWEQILGDTNAPYFNSLLTNASYASRYFSPPGLHPSLPNYIWLYAGTNFGILDDNNPSMHHFATHEHLPYLLDRAGVPWKSYQENITGTDCPVTGTSPYAVRHNPAMYFDDVTSDFEYCTNHVRPYPELEQDLSNHLVSGFVYITPNTANDMHSAPVKTGDDWLAAELPKILNSAAFSNNGAVFIAWDEDDFGTPQDPIGMIMLSPLAKGGGYMNTNYYTHSSTLRTFQEIFGVRPFLNNAASASDLSDFFKLLAVNVSGVSDGQVLLTVTNSVPGKTNILEASSDLVNWVGISTNVSVTNSLQVLDTPAGPDPRRFYRIYEQR
jgi:hypothetical protein